MKGEVRYLLHIMRMLEEGEKPRTTSLARKLGIKPACVTEVLQILSDKGVIEYKRYRGFKLTRKGVRLGRNLLRGHRLLELLLVDFLKYDAETACEEASKLDGSTSPKLINAICRKYKHPSRCPCGKLIFEDPSCRRRERTTGPVSEVKPR